MQTNPSQPALKSGIWRQNTAMKPDIYYFLDIALNKSKTPTNRLNKAKIALEQLKQIIDYLQSINTNTNGQTEQKTESRKTKCNSISARN